MTDGIPQELVEGNPYIKDLPVWRRKQSSMAIRGLVLNVFQD